MENLTGGTPPVRYLPCVVPCKLYFVSKYIFDHVPFIFQNNEENYVLWRENIANNLKIDPSDICISGSAAIGFSLSPEKLFKPFHDQSDIDVCIISAYYFDTAWNELLQMPKRPQDYKMRSAVDDHRSRLIYWGTIATDKILPLLSFGPNWDRIIRSSKTFDMLKDRDINFRIYKDRLAIRRYLCDGIRKCKDNLIKEELE